MGFYIKKNSNIVTVENLITGDPEFIVTRKLWGRSYSKSDVSY